MTSGRSPIKHQRSGLHQRTPKAKAPPANRQTTREMMLVLHQMQQESTLPVLLAKAHGLLDDMERDALAAFARHGLPDHNGRYRRAPGGVWEPVSVAPAVGSPFVQMSPVPDDVSWSYCTLAQVGELECDADSEVGFAVPILRLVADARETLAAAGQENDGLAVRACIQALSLAGARSRWTEEYKLAPLIAPTLSQDEGRRRGGENSARIKATAQRRQAREWQEQARAIENEAPGLTQEAMAIAVRKKLKLTQSTRTIIRRLKMSDSS